MAAAAAADQLAWRTLESYLGLSAYGRGSSRPQRSVSQSSGQAPSTISGAVPSG